MDKTLALDLYFAAEMVTLTTSSGTVKVNELVLPLLPSLIQEFPFASVAFTYNLGPPEMLNE